MDAPLLDVDASAGEGMATFSHVGFAQQSFLQFRMNIVIVDDLLASLVERSPVMCDFREGIERIHGGWGMGDRNDEGEEIVETALAFDLAIVNTFFEKKVNQYVTYNSGGRESQIDFLMCRRCRLKEVINCKVINGEAVAAQHRVLVIDWEIQRGKKKPEQATPRIKWWRLKCYYRPTASLQLNNKRNTKYNITVT